MLEDLSQHILDIAENGVNAGADSISLKIDDGPEEVVLIVSDNGKGMDEQTCRSVVDPFFTSRTERRVGLGLPFLKQLADLCGGSFALESFPGLGTTVSASFRKDSIDMPPLGDIPSTLLALFIGNPDISWMYTHKRNGKEFSVGNRELSEALGGGNPFSDPSLALGIKDYLRENISDLYS